MSECTQDCSSCGEDCPSRKMTKEDFLEKPNELSRIGKVIGIVSGKGGVGKSLVTGLLAVQMNRRGHKVAIMDADLTGPSIPKMFGITQKATGTGSELFPVASRTGIGVMSVNLLLERDTDPVVWRGPVIAGVVKQFWTDVIWDDVDYMFVDMPPGTGDVPLTIFQSVPVDGIIVVTSPQELANMIVTKAVKMAGMMDIPILGVVENMSYAICPDCGAKIEVFGHSHAEETAASQGLPLLARLPVDPAIARQCDEGQAEDIEAPWLEGAADAVEKL